MKLSINQPGSLAGTHPPWESVAEPWPDHDGVIYAYGHVQGNEHWMHIPGLATFRFSPAGTEVAAIVSKTCAHEEVIDAFHRRVLPMAVHVSGREVLHASAIRSNAGVVGFCGITRSGKSTIAFGLNARGYSLWADDIVAFDFADGVPRAVSLPFRPRLRKSSAPFFSSETIQTNLVAYDAAAEQRAPLAGVCILRKDTEACQLVSIRQLSAVDALAAVLEHSCCFFPQSDERKRLMIRHYLDLVALTPVFEVSFRPELQNFPALLDAVERLLESALQSA